jgi:hypothetical protein
MKVVIVVHYGKDAMSYVTVIVNDPKNQHKKQVGGQGLLQ